MKNHPYSKALCPKGAPRSLRKKWHTSIRVKMDNDLSGDVALHEAGKTLAKAMDLIDRHGRGISPDRFPEILWLRAQLEKSTSEAGIPNE